MHSTLNIQNALPLFLKRCKEAGIKNPDKYLASKVPTTYSYLKGCFPYGTLPTDVDGEIEIDGHYLRLEFKEEAIVKNNTWRSAQKIAFLKLVEKKQFTLFLIGHDDRGAVTILRWVKPAKYNTYQTGIIDPCNEERLAQACKNWVSKL
jgi:hypothetical protein